MTRHLLRFAFAAGLLVANPSHAAVRFVAALDRHTEPIEGTKNVPPDQHRTLSVTLAEQAIVVDDGNERTVYDFAKRREIHVDLQAKTRVDYSLYAMPAFRAFELQNRARMRQAFAAAKIQSNATPIDDEQALSIQDQPASPLQESTDATFRYFRDGDRTMCRETLHATPLPPSEARRFAQFVRNVAAGHPQILERLGAASEVPDELTMTTYAFGIATTTIRFRSVAEVDGVSTDATAYALRRTPAGGDPIDRILDRAANMTQAELDGELRANVDATAKAFADGHVFDGFLGTLERTLMTGATPQITDQQRAAFGADESTTKARVALAAKDKTTFATAVDSFVQLRHATDTHGHVLAIWEANDRRQLGDAPGGQRLFVEVLEAHPAIAGVYKDLGDTLMGSWDMMRAWRAYDVGRRIAPAFANFRAIDQLEQQLATRHPEFF